LCNANEQSKKRRSFFKGETLLIPAVACVPAWVRYAVCGLRALWCAATVITENTKNTKNTGFLFGAAQKAVCAGCLQTHTSPTPVFPVFPKFPVGLAPPNGSQNVACLQSEAVLPAKKLPQNIPFCGSIRFRKNHSAPYCS